MKKRHLLILLALLVGGGVWAQGVCPTGYTWLDTIVVNGTATSTYLPLGSVANSGQYYHTMWTVYTREEIEESGIFPGSTIRQVGWRLQTANLYGPPEVNIYMKEVPVREVSATSDSIPLDSMTLVYTTKGTTGMIFFPGWTYVALDTAFTYSGRGHLMIAVQRNGGAGGITDRRFYATSGKSICRYKSQTGVGWVSQLRTGSNGRPVMALRACAGPDVCPRPAVEFTATDSSITVHMGEHDSLYHVVLGPVGFQPDTVGLFSPRSWLSWDDTVRYDLLNPGSKYDIYVRQRCGDYYSLWSGPHTIHTFCGVQQLPYTLTLTQSNAADALDSCWMLHDAVLNGVNILPRAATQAETDSGVVVKAVAVLPEFDEPLNRLHFSYGGLVGMMREIGVVTDADDPSTFIPYDTLDLADWGRETDFSRYTGPAGRVAIRWEQGRAFSLVSVDTVAGCYAPYQPQVDSVVDTTVYVSWRSRTPRATQWRVSYSTHPTYFNYYTTVLTDTTTLRIDSLLPNRYYYLRLRSVCEDSIMSSYHTNTLKFLTACRPIDRLPYRMDATMKLYSSGEMPCWTEVTDTVTNQKYFISPRFDTTAVRMDQLKIMLDCGFTHASMLQMGVMEDPSDLTTFVAFDSMMTVAWRTSFYNRMRHGCHLAFRVATNAVFHIDTLTVEQSVVHPVSELRRVGCTPTSITVDWTEQGDATQWLVRCQRAEDGLDTQFVAMAKPATITGLQPYTPTEMKTYTVSVCALHDGDTSLPVQGVYAAAPAEHYTALRIETDTLSSAATTYQPFNRTHKHTWTQLLYPMTEYATAGWIDTVWFHCRNRINLNLDQDTSVTLYMGISDFDHAEGPFDWVPEERLHRVWHGRTVKAESDDQWVPIVLDSAFYYDGQGALALVFSRSFHQQYYSFDSYHYCYKQQGVVMYRAGADTTFAQYPSTIGSRNGTLFGNLPVARFSFYTSDCHNVDSLRVVSTSFDSVTLAWRAQGDEQQWQVVYWAEDGHHDSAMVADVPQTTLTGLRGSQWYWFRVRPVCDTADTGLFYGLDSCHVVSCSQPYDLRVMTVGDSSATLVWNGMAATQQGQIVVYAADGSWGDTMAVTGTQTTLSGLMPRTYYVAKVQGVCGTGDTSAYSPTLTFRTTGTGIMYNLAQVGNLNAPHISGPAPIEVFWKHGWSQTIYEADSIGTYGYIDTLWYYAEQVGTDAYDTSVTIFMGHTPLASHPSDSAWLQASDLTQVYHSSSALPSDTGWFPIVLNPPFEYNGRDNLAVAISYQATNWTVDWKFAYYSNMPYYYLRRGHDTDASYSSHPGTIPGNRATIMPIARFSMAVDTMAPPFCMPVHGVRVDEDTAGTVVVSWLPYPADSIYRCVYSATDGSDSGSFVTSSTSMALSGLLPMKTYRFALTTLCRSGELTQSVEVMYTTPCGTISQLPWADGFETVAADVIAGQEPYCWRVYVEDFSDGVVDTSEAYTGHSCMKLSGNVIAVLPDFDTTAVDVSSVLVTFYAYNSPEGGQMGLSVGTVTDVEGTETFMPVDTVATQGIYTRYMVPLSHYEVQGYGLALRSFSMDSTAGEVFVDSVRVEAIAATTGVMVDGVTQHEATVHIVDHSSATGYTVMVVRDSAGIFDTTTYAIADTVLPLQGLQPATRYCVWVRNEYADGVYHSRWIGPACFNTLAEIHWYHAQGQSSDASMGYVTLDLVEGEDSAGVMGLYAEGSVLEFTAHALSSHIRFVRWDDGITDNPRRLVLTQDTLLRAIFEEQEGIDPVVSTGVMLIPNPASERVTVEAGVAMDELECRDMQGRLVAQHTDCGERFVLDVSRWPSGMYYVRVRTADGCVVVRLVVR